jgi:hypothetical protein
MRLQGLFIRHPDLCEQYDLRREGNTIRRSARRRLASLADVLVTLLCALDGRFPHHDEWRQFEISSVVKNLRGLDRILKFIPEDPEKSCGLAQCHDVAQVASLLQMRAEIAADCWRLWLDGSTQPDPRPWADILAAGDNKRVVKAERVAFLDWQRPGRDGKPARRPWPQAQWPDLRAAPGPQESREAA